MNKQDIVRDLKQFVGGGAFISQNELMKYCRRGKPAIRELLDGLEKDKDGKAYRYFIPDVAGRIKERSML